MMPPLKRSASMCRQFRLFLLLAVCCAAFAPPSHGQTFTVLHTFTGGQDGSEPAAGPILDAAGNLYGTTLYGGVGNGNVYKASYRGGSWIFSPLYSLLYSDGAYPDYGGLTFGPDGTLYGTTSSGGNGPYGTVFNLRPPASFCRTVACDWNFTLLHNFGSGNDGVDPLSNLAFDSAGNLYGTTNRGGDYGYGTVFEMSRSGGSWTETVLYSFNAQYGDNPVAGVVLDANGNLYGTAYGGGDYGFGAVYELTNNGSGWAEQVLYSFTNGRDGRAPTGGVIFDGAGNLYGTAQYGGAGGGGTVYKLTPGGGGWRFSVLYSMAGTVGPYNTVTMDSAGNLYDTTYQGGLYGSGSVFKLSPSNGGWIYTDLHDFTDGSDGGEPTSRVAVDPAGNVYGTTSGAGTYNRGVLFEITP